MIREGYRLWFGKCNDFNLHGVFSRDSAAHSNVNTTLLHYIKDVPEVTANGMAQVEQLFSKLDSGEQAVQ